MITRRDFVWWSAGLLAGCQTVPRAGDKATAHPFSLGIASGDPTHDSVILWTRVAADPFAPPSDRPVTVGWTVARDAELRDVVGSGVVVALPEHAHCVHVDVRGLAPDQHYYYRFEAFGRPSPLGRTRTLPEPGTPLDQFSIALTSCQEYSVGYFTAYRDLLEQQPNLVLHNGDYIYESPAGTVRPYPISGEAVSLADYRALYAQYRQDADLRTAHAMFPWIVIWDDHEVSNDWGPEHFLPSPYNEPMPVEAHRQRVRVARKAFLEHMPLRASLSLYKGNEPVFYRKDVIGDLLELSRLDVRSYRDTPVCSNGLALEFRECPEIFDPGRSMLGREQEQWLIDNYASSGCVWNCLAQTTVFAPFDRMAGPEKRFETDSWDNYAANRNRIIDHIRNNEVSNAVSLGGNIHAFYAGSVTDAFTTNTCRDAVMTEIVTTSISAGGGDETRFNDVLGRLDENPCIQFFDNRYRGYTLLRFSRENIVADFRVVDQIETFDGTFATLASMLVETGSVSVTHSS